MEIDIKMFRKTCQHHAEKVIVYNNVGLNILRHNVFIVNSVVAIFHLGPNSNFNKVVSFFTGNI